MRPSLGEVGVGGRRLGSLAVRSCQIPTKNSCWRVEKRRRSRLHRRPRSLRGGVGHHRVWTLAAPPRLHIAVPVYAFAFFMPFFSSCITPLGRNTPGCPPPPPCSIKPVVRAPACSCLLRNSPAAAPPGRSDIRGTSMFPSQAGGGKKKTASIGNLRRRFVCLNGIPPWGEASWWGSVWRIAN